MCFLFPCQLTFIFHLSYQLILRFRWIRFVTNSFEVHRHTRTCRHAHTHTHNTPYTTPLQRNKTKTLRSYKCKPVILLVSAPWLTNGTTDRIFPLHFNLEYVPCSFYLLASIFCCCELLCATQFISIMETVAERVALWVSNDLQLHWCQYLRGKKEGGGLLRIKGLDLKRTSVSLQMHFLKMLRWILPAVTERQFGLYVCVCQEKRRWKIWYQLEPRPLRYQWENHQLSFLLLLDF